jgi:1-deoxy-D-xylulose-5-phosphate reductoisomerase
MKKNISILGITGSIGKSALNIYENFKDQLNIIAVSTNTSIKSFLDIIDKYKPAYGVVFDRNIMYSFFHEYETVYHGVKIYSGEQGLNMICSDKANDMILNGISGVGGLKPSISILENGIDLALANKESMVCAGKYLNSLSNEKKCRIIPVDSEHSAIFQLLNKYKKKDIADIYLTASGGPFLKLEKSKWDTITVEDALNHPTWKMGNKISIDSATMANKGLEVIEAHELFDFDFENIKVIIHPQSLVHSMIECNDGELYAQIGPNDMSIPIQNAIFYPEIKYNSYNRFDFSKNVVFEFFPVDFNKFKMLSLAYECGKRGGLYPAIYNFLNDYLVGLFLTRKIPFISIEILMEKSIEMIEKNNEINLSNFSIDSINSMNNLIKKTINGLI